MKDMSKVAELIAALKNEIETPYELAAVERLERELVEGAPKVEVIDENHQKFNGMIFHKRASGHFYVNFPIHQAVWIYHFGRICDGYDVHHKDAIKSNNDISNLISVTKSDHMKIHAASRKKQDKPFICEKCGKKFYAWDCGNNKFCSDHCKHADQYAKHKTEEICPVCGKRFTTNKYRPSKTCSAKCGAIRAQSIHRTTYVCKNCGKEFESTTSGIKLFCSGKCQYNWYRNSDENKIKRNCLICGKEFFVHKDDKAQTCSNSCASKLGILRKKKNASKASDNKS